MFVLNKITNKDDIQDFLYKLKDLDYEELDLDNIRFETPFEANNVIQIFPCSLSHNFDLNHKCNILNQAICFSKLLFGDWEEKEYYFPTVIFTWSEIY